MLRLWLVTSTLIILDVTETSFNIFLLLLLFSFALNNLCEAPQIKLIMDTSVSATIGLWQQFCTLISCKVFIYKYKWRERWVDGKTDR